MSSAWSQLEQMLTCAICLDKFKNPRLLPCQHSFCGDACMEGLVDYARRQIKCPECRAEHRIPYQGVASLPSNVTLIRFLELHSRITGEDTEPVPTFLEKCSVCGEKVEGVARCAHCDKKTCPECKEAHIDILRREIGRVNGQSKRCLGKLLDFKESLKKADERLGVSHKSVKREIQDSCQRLIEDLQAKQKSFIDELDSFVESERKVIDKLKAAVVDELKILEANTALADEKLTSNKFPWTDLELNEAKEIYTRIMEFVRLFDPEIGDYNRKIRFSLIPEFEALRRRICELGELKFGETACSLIANSFQYCNANGQLAIELCNQAAAQQAAQAAANQNSATSGPGGYGLAHSNSNSNLGGGPSSTMLDVPSMQNALMRSQSDHRLASQFQQRLKQQQQELASNQASKSGYGGIRANAASSQRDYETESIRSRYAPPRSSKDYQSDLLRDWPRPGDNDDISFGSSIQFKSAFMRRKEKERQQMSSAYSTGTGGYATNEDDDDLTSEASYAGSRNVRFHDSGGGGGGGVNEPARFARQFDCKDLEHAPFSGVPKLDDCPHLLTRLHQMGAKAIVDKKLAEEEGKRDRDLVESARQAMTLAAERAKARQISEDELEKQKQMSNQSNPEPVQQVRQQQRNRSPSLDRAQLGEELSPRDSPIPERAPMNSSSSSTVLEAAEPIHRGAAPTTATTTAAAAPSSEPSSPSTTAASRRNLYGQAVNEKSKRQLSSAIQDAAYAATVRRRTAASRDSIDTSEAATEPTSSSSIRPKRVLKSSRSMSRQASQEQSDGSTATQRRRRPLNRGDSSQQSIDSPSLQDSLSQQQSKNLTAGSGGEDIATGAVARRPLYASTSSSARNSSRVDEAASITTEDDESSVAAGLSRRSGTSKVAPAAASSDSTDQDEDDVEDEAVTGAENGADKYSGRNAGNRRSREFLPTAVNKLLDRSAQIRRDSQEQRLRGDSPKRDTPRYSATSTAATSSPSSSYYSASSRVSGYSSPRRLAYQRSTSIRNDDDDSTAASSSGLRKSSQEDDAPSYSATSNRRSSNDRSYSSRTNSQETTTPYQSRFLSKSRTSAALARSQESSEFSTQRGSLDHQESGAAYLSSRDRFMQSSGVGSPTATATSPTAATSSSSAAGALHSDYLRSKYGSSRKLASTCDSDSEQDEVSITPYADKGEMLFKIGSRGNGPGKFTWPRGVAIGKGARGREIVVADSSNHRVQVFNAEGAFSHEFGGYGSGQSEFDCLAGVAINKKSKNYIVSDRYNHRVQVFDFRGNFVRSFGEMGHDDGQFNLPWGIACDANGLIYVCDKENHRIQVFDVEGNFIHKFGEPGNKAAQLQHPHYIATSADGRNHLVVTDTNNHRVQVFDCNGRMVQIFGSEGIADGQFKFPRGVAMDKDGYIIVGDSGNNRVQVFTPNGTFVKSIGTWGSADGEFKGIEGVAVDSRRYILVCDRENHRIQVF